MTDRLDLPLPYRTQIHALLCEHVPEAEVWAYGSRVNGSGHESSELDLVLRGPRLERLGEGYLSLLEAIEESNIPILVQVHDWATLPGSLRREIQRRYAVFQKRLPRSSAIANESGHAWRTVALREIADIFDGPHATPQKTESGPVFLGISNLVSGRIDLSVTRHLSENDYLAWTRRITPQPSDIVFSYETRLGEAAAIPRGLRCCLGRRMGLLRARTGVVDPRFLLYAYLGPAFQETLRSRAVPGSTVDRIPLSEMGSFAMQIPVDVGEHRAIAHVLGTLDDKIELNRRMNETLEQMARALFKSWFVDFDPVRAKMEGRWRAGQSLPGLPAHLYDLFPSRLAPSELGPIPEGWHVKPLGDCFNLTMGQSPPGSTYNDDGKGFPFFQGNADFGFRYPEKRRYCTAPTRMAYPDDALVSVRAPVGAINMAWEECCIGRGVAALRHKSGSSSFTYYSTWVLQVEIQQYEQTGTVFGAINKNQFELLRAIEPDPKIVDEFESYAHPLDRRIMSNIAESRALVSQRDVLLPGLVSGDVGIRV